MSNTERKVPNMVENQEAHAHNVDHVVKHYKEGAFMHESEKYRKHAAGSTPFHEHVKKMCHGGKA